MTDVHAAVSENRAALEAFESAARTLPADRWALAPAEGRWSPGQVVEHVAISYEQASAALAGTSTMPAFPRVLRPLIRWLLLSKVLETGRFPKGAKAPAGFAPGATPAPRELGLARLRDSASKFERDAATSRAASIDHPVFGRLALVDYVRLVARHTGHHAPQLGQGR